MSVCQNISQTEWKWSIPKFFNIGEACSDRVCKEGKKDKIAMIVEDDIKYKLNKNQLVLKFKNEEELNKIIEFLKRG